MLTTPMFMGGGVTKRSPQDLTELFATEINEYYGGNVWSFVTDINNVDNIVVGDWVPTEVNGYAYDMEITCINCYEGECYDNDDPVYDGSDDGAVTKVPSHIDIISKQLYDYSCNWFGTDDDYNNNGSIDQQCPWLHSDLYAYLQNTVFPLLPQELQNVVIEKCMLIERRYDSSGIIANPTGECWQPIGKIWVPNEIEIFGEVIHSDSTYGNYGIQYKTFNSSSKRIRYRPTSSLPIYWWSLSPYSGSGTAVIRVNHSGDTTSDGAYAEHYFPLCVRVELK